jgi:hypothetical protein
MFRAPQTVPQDLLLIQDLLGPVNQRESHLNSDDDNISSSDSSSISSSDPDSVSDDAKSEAEIEDLVIPPHEHNDEDGQPKCVCAACNF